MLKFLPNIVQNIQRYMNVKDDSFKLSKNDDYYLNVKKAIGNYPSTKNNTSFLQIWYNVTQ